jgi:GST-like protein
MAEDSSSNAADNQPPGYVPPRVWTWDAPSAGGRRAAMRATSGG